MATRWQYKVVELKPTWFRVSSEQLEGTLSTLGQQGWELVSVTYYGAITRMFLKKEA